MTKQCVQNVTNLKKETIKREFRAYDGTIAVNKINIQLQTSIKG